MISFADNDSIMSSAQVVFALKLHKVFLIMHIMQVSLAPRVAVQATAGSKHPTNLWTVKQWKPNRHAAEEQSPRTTVALSGTECTTVVTWALVWWNRGM